jgi:hypothetical protein
MRVLILALSSWDSISTDVPASQSEHDHPQPVGVCRSGDIYDQATQETEDQVGLDKRRDVQLADRSQLTPVNRSSTARRLNHYALTWRAAIPRPAASTRCASGAATESVSAAHAVPAADQPMTTIRPACGGDISLLFDSAAIQTAASGLLGVILKFDAGDRQSPPPHWI